MQDDCDQRYDARGRAQSEKELLGLLAIDRYRGCNASGGDYCCISAECEKRESRIDRDARRERERVPSEEKQSKYIEYNEDTEKYRGEIRCDR